MVAFWIILGILLYIISGILISLVGIILINDMKLTLGGLLFALAIGTFGGIFNLIPVAIFLIQDYSNTDKVLIDFSKKSS